MSKVDLRALTNLAEIFDAKKNNGHLWAVNISDKGGKQKRGDVMVVIKDENGADVTILLPATWLPQDLLQYTSLANFERSTSFRSYLRTGLLAIIDHASAQRLMKLPNFKDESERVRALTANMQHAMAVNTNENIVLNTASNTAIVESPVISESAEDLNSGNTSQVRALLERVNGAGISNFDDVKSELISFLVNASDTEVKAMASGISDSTSPAFAYLDTALNAFAEGAQVTEDMLNAVTIEANSGGGISFNIS